jgi:hypothetical protein
MLKAIGVLLICLSALAAFSDTSGYQVGTITAVTHHRGAAGSDPSVASYDVSVRVGNTVYVVLYTPPFGTDTVQYVAGRDLPVLVGEKTLTFNDELGTTSEVPILSRTTIATQSSSSPTLDSAQQRNPIKSVDVIGLVGVKDNTGGALVIDAGKLRFTSPKGTSVIDAASIEDVVTGNDSQRAVRGALGTVSMFGPYGSGRVLSLFRSKVDTLTIQYRDPDGGLHGAIFTMPSGESESFKKELLAAGARTSIPSQPEQNAESTKASGATEEKP